MYPKKKKTACQGAEGWVYVARVPYTEKCTIHPRREPDEPPLVGLTVGFFVVHLPAPSPLLHTPRLHTRVRIHFSAACEIRPLHTFAPKSPQSRCGLLGRTRLGVKALIVEEMENKITRVTKESAPASRIKPGRCPCVAPGEWGKIAWGYTQG